MFVVPDPDGRPAPARLVHQGNLFDDTKLIIYKTPARKKNRRSNDIAASPSAALDVPQESPTRWGSTQLSCSLLASQLLIVEQFIRILHLPKSIYCIERWINCIKNSNEKPSLLQIWIWWQWNFSIFFEIIKKSKLWPPKDRDLKNGKTTPIGIMGTSSIA